MCTGVIPPPFTPDEPMASSAKAAPAKITHRHLARHRSPAAAKRAPQPRALALDDPSLFINRELSLLDFQRRVLEEAQDSTNPPLDRVMFLSFVGSNLDEFFMVRVAGLKRQIEKGVIDSGPDAMGPAELLRAIRASVIRLNRAAYECWLKELVPALRKSGLRIANFADLTDEQRAVADAYFQDTIFPTLTPLAFDPGRPFPHISNLSLNLAVVLPRCRGRRALCAREDSRHAAAVGAGDGRPKGQEPRQGCGEGTGVRVDRATGDGQSWERFSPAWKSSRRIPST